MQVSQKFDDLHHPNTGFEEVPIVPFVQDEKDTKVKIWLIWKDFWLIW